MKFLLSFFKDKSRFLGMLVLWILAGGYAGPLFYLVIPVSILIMVRQKSYSDIFMGFFLILVLSDSRQPLFQFAGKIKDIFILMLGVFYFLNKNDFEDEAKLYKRFGIFLGIAVFCLIFSEILLTNIQKTLSFFLILLVVPNYFIKAYKNDGTQFLKWLIAFGVLILLAGNVIRYVNPDFVFLKGRFNGLLGNPNGLGLFSTLFLIVIIIIREYFPLLISKREFGVSIFICFLSIYLCGSRTSLIASALFFVFRAVYKISPYLGFMIFLLFIYLYYLVSANIEEIIISVGLQEYFRLETFDTGSGRIIAWSFGWEQIVKSPIFGKGIGYTDYFYRKNYDYLAMLGHQGNAHNSFITFWMDTGIFGLLAYLIALMRTFIRGAANSRSAIPAMYAILFSAFFESWLTASLNPFTIQMLIILTIIVSPVFNIKPQEDEIAEEQDETEKAPDPVY